MTYTVEAAERFVDGTLGEWINLTERVESFSIKRGRNVETDEFSSGTASIEFDNSDGVLTPARRDSVPERKSYRQFRADGPAGPTGSFTGFSANEGDSIHITAPSGGDAYAWAIPPRHLGYAGGALRGTAIPGQGTDVVGFDSSYRIILGPESTDGYVSLSGLTEDTPIRVTANLEATYGAAGPAQIGVMVGIRIIRKSDGGDQGAIVFPNFTGSGTVDYTWNIPFDATAYQVYIQLTPRTFTEADAASTTVTVSNIVTQIGEPIRGLARPGTRIRITDEGQEIADVSVERWRSDLMHGGLVSAELVDDTDSLAELTIDDGDHYVFTAANPYAFFPLDEETNGTEPVYTSTSTVNEEATATWRWHGVPEKLTAVGITPSAGFGADSIILSGRGSAWTTGLSAGFIREGVGSDYTYTMTGAVLQLRNADGSPVPILPITRRAWGMSFYFRGLDTIAPIDTLTGNQGIATIAHASARDDNGIWFSLEYNPGSEGSQELYLGVGNGNGVVYKCPIQAGPLDNETHFFGVISDPKSRSIRIKFDDQVFTYVLTAVDWGMVEPTSPHTPLTFGGNTRFESLGTPAMVTVQNVAVYLWPEGDEPSDFGWLLSSWDQDYFTGPGQLETTRIERLLAVASRGTRSLIADPGLSPLSRDSIANGGNVLSQLRAYARSASGSLFVNSAGEVVYQNRDRRAEFTNPIILSANDLSSNVEIETDKKDILNRVDLDVNFGIKLTLRDQPSIRRHGERGISLPLSVSDDDEGIDAALEYLARYANEQPRITTLSIRLSADSTGTLANTWRGVEPGQPVLLTDIPGQEDMRLYVESADLKVTVDGEVEEAVLTLALSPSFSRGFWRLGDPVKGSLGVSTYPVY